MSLDDIIRAWKSDEQRLDPRLPASPLGRELSEEELLDVLGSLGSPSTECLGQTCSVGGANTCVATCNMANTQQGCIMGTCAITCPATFL